MKFNDFGFKKFINDCLQSENITTPTPIQEKVIPLFKKNHSIIGKSNTGTGKTFAFLLPILNNIDYDKKNQIQATIIAPTRELAYQIYQVCKKFTKYEPRINAKLFTGGDSIEDQRRKLLIEQPMICICTPSRMSTLYNENTLKITTSDYLVIDECDMIFELGFIDDIDLIVSKIKDDAKKLVFSATISEECRIFLEKYFTNCLYLEVKEKSINNTNIENILIWTKNRENKEVIQALLKTLNPYICLIFVNHKKNINTVNNWLQEIGLRAAIISGDIEANKRLVIFKKIKNLEFKYVICTDLASRGVDIEAVSHVISIDLPNDLSYYIHRCGRTGRANNTGISYVLQNSKNQAQVEELKKQGITFTNYRFVDSQLVPVDTKKIRHSKNKVFKPKDNEISRIQNKYKKQKVKPGYKTKINKEIEEYKLKKRRQHIKESIDKIKKDRYKKRREDIFEK
ncbi:DEAD/DEAH box helicase [Spiroplasma endosymbiont of Aspidapion aeneum]|uniref:DEAD/DEAH box helicase n=1 Tax=Spiroplasma endosymbiont of Aspidapion aeneum TaxID=3066276 RepID=UPI00313E2BB3